MKVRLVVNRDPGAAQRAEELVDQPIQVGRGTTSNMQNRRNLLTAVGSEALVSLLTSTRHTMAQSADATPPPTTINTVPTDPFILLLKGIYEPITSGLELGLTGINPQPIQDANLSCVRHSQCRQSQDQNGNT